ncbi:MAG: PPA1309 family protein [Propionibacterium sp.]
MTSPSRHLPSETDEPLTAALVEIEHHVAHGGWDQPARLFALVPTADLLLAEPSLAGQLTVTAADQLSSVEQEDFHDGSDVLTALATIGWGDAVTGCALCTERSFLPAQAEPDIPEDPDLAADYVAGHPQREDIRVVVGVLRDGTGYGVARLASSPEELLAGPDLVPALSRALARTFMAGERQL